MCDLSYIDLHREKSCKNLAVIVLYRLCEALDDIVPTKQLDYELEISIT